jgi:hypothetical protein
MSKTALLESSKRTDPVPGREVKITWARRLGNPKQALSPTPPLAERLRAHLSSLTPLEAAALFTLVNRQATGEHTLLKYAAGDKDVED